MGNERLQTPGRASAPAVDGLRPRAVHATTTDAVEAIGNVKDAFQGLDLALLLLFCSSAFPLDDLASELRAAFPAAPIAGCTTAGEIGPAGYVDGSLVALGLPASGFTASVRHIADIDGFDEDSARLLAADMLREGGGSSVDTFSLLLVDGLCIREERLARQCQRALGDIPLVGGSAGDDQRYVATHVLHAGGFTGGAVWVVVRTSLPFAVFRSSHFVGDSEPLVVTEADATQRLLREINGRPAAMEYARVLGLDRAELSEAHGAAAPLVVRIGGTDYVRSIQRIEPDDSLRLHCAIERGVVLRVARAGDLVAARRTMLGEIGRTVGSPVATIGFDCIHCKLEAEALDGKTSVQRVFEENTVVGFSSYGEQYLGVHVNQTFSGVMIGEPAL